RICTDGATPDSHTTSTLYMPSTRVGQSLRHHWGLGRFGPGLRSFVALSLCTGWGWLFDRIDALIPLYLGVIASALAESDDSWQGRLLAVGVSLVCFLFISTAIELLHPYTLWLSVFIVAATFTLIVLGGAGSRYASVSYATLILGIYTRLGLGQHGADSPTMWHYGTLLLCS